MPRSKLPRVDLKLQLKREVTREPHWSKENIGWSKYFLIPILLCSEKLSFFSFRDAEIMREKQLKAEGGKWHVLQRQLWLYTSYMLLCTPNSVVCLLRVCRVAVIKFLWCVMEFKIRKRVGRGHLTRWRIRVTNWSRVCQSEMGTPGLLFQRTFLSPRQKGKYKLPLALGYTFSVNRGKYDFFN